MAGLGREPLAAFLLRRHRLRFGIVFWGGKLEFQTVFCISGCGGSTLLMKMVVKMSHDVTMMRQQEKELGHGETGARKEEVGGRG